MAARTIGDLVDEARAGLQRLEPAAALAAMQDGALLIDTRCAEARARHGVIEGSHHVPLSVLFWRVDDTSGHHDPRLARRDAQLVLLCADGYSSSIAAATLQQLGFDRATDVVGGFTAWRAAGLPVSR
jgi:rhodanese-related sulfurtransferase